MIVFLGLKLFHEALRVLSMLEPRDTCIDRYPLY
jgi:hypothetical protein